MQPNITEVVFLIEKSEDNLPGAVFAFFPNEKERHALDMFTCYSHIGQHSTCHITYAHQCKEARPAEYADLKKELEALGYKLKVVPLTRQQIPNYHILQVRHWWPVGADGPCVKIISERFEQTIKIPYTNEAGAGEPALDTAFEYLTKKGWNIIGKGSGKDHYYLITDTFQPLREKKKQ